MRQAQQPADCQPLKARRLLKRIANAELRPLCDAEQCDILPIEKNLAGRRLFDPHNDPGKSGFPPSVRPGYNHKFPIRQR